MADDARRLLAEAISREEAADFTAAQQLAEQAAEVAARLKDTDDAESMSLWVDIEVACARMLSTLGAFEQAEARLAGALAVANKGLPTDHPCVVSIHNMRGVTAK